MPRPLRGRSGWTEASDRATELDRGIVVRTGAGILISFAVSAVALALTYPGAPPDADPILLRYVDYIQLASIVVPTLIAFFGFYLARGDMRDAIAGSFFITFAIILAESIVLSLGLFGYQPGSIREVLMNNFLNLTGTVALFYFGSEAVIQVARQRAVQEADARRAAPEA